jgi:hypothetical protein
VRSPEFKHQYHQKEKKNTMRYRHTATRWLQWEPMTAPKAGKAAEGGTGSLIHLVDMELCTLLRKRLAHHYHQLHSWSLICHMKKSLHKNLHVNVHSSFICNNQKLEAISILELN